MKNDTIQRKKRITTCLSTLLTFCLVLTGVLLFAPIEAEAAVGDEFTVNKMEYRVLTEEEGNYTVEVSDAYYVTDAEVVIPETVSYGSHTYTVTAIGNSAFISKRGIQSISIPNTVTEIKGYAFQNCDSLTKLVIPDSVTKIHDYAFYKANGLETITIPESVTAIGSYAFSTCSNLTSVTILSTNASFSSSAIPTTVTVYGYGGSTTETYCTEKGISFSALTVISIEIPDEFLNQLYLIDGEFAPFDITATYNNGMTDTVRVTADMVTGFFTVTARENATATVTCGEATATFTYTVTRGYPYKVEHYRQNYDGDGYTFYGVLTYYGIGETAATAHNYEGFTAQDFEQAAIEEDGSTVIKIYYDLVPIAVGDTFTYEHIVYEVLTSGEGEGTLAVVGHNLQTNTNVVIPATVQYLDKIYTVTEIAEYAFQNCELLGSIDLPNTVVAINNFAFFGATNLQSIDIPESVVSIGDGAFRKSGLTSLTVPATVQSIGMNLCYECADLVTVKIYAPIAEIGQLAFSRCTKLESVTLPSTLTTINWQAFWNCSSLQEINLHEGITTIDGQAFSKCSSLKEITIPSTVTTMGDSIFSQCSALETVNIYTKAAVGATMFSSCNALTEVKAYYGSGVHTQLDSGIFTPIYDVTFDVDGGEGADFDGFNGIALEVGDEVAFIDAYSPSKFGYTFAGWLGEDENTYASGDTFTLVAVEDKDVITFTAQYVDRQVESITIPAASQNQSYVVDGAFVPFDITVNYDNGETETVQVTAAMVEGFSTDSVTETAQTATVTYGEQTANFTYTVVLCMDHDYDNGFCTVCDAYQPADLTTDKYDVDGDGEFDEVYEIGNAGQLYWFADKVNNDWDNFKNANAVLTDDIVVNENVVVDGELNPDADAVASFRVWTAIGNYPDDKPFSGIFDGRGHTVSGLYHNDDYYETGLFEDLSGTVRNVGVMNSYLYGDSQVGAIAGRAKGNARILNCFSINNCIGICDGGGEMGGIVGSTWIGTGESTGIIANCWSAYIYAFDYAGPVGGCEISTHHDYPNRLPFENCYYLADSETDIHTGTTYKTAAQFASGEVAYLLGESWGQTLEGENKNAYPVLGGAKVNYGYTTCDAAQSEKIYTNDEATEVKPSHTDGAAATCTDAQTCTVCGTVLTEALGHMYDEQLDNTLKTGATNCQENNIYWYDCSRCGESAKNDPSATDKWYESSEIGAHSMSSEWTNENGQHFHKCTVDGCTHTEDEGTCVGGTAATCTTAQTCTTCGDVLEEALDHDFENRPWTDLGESGHAHKCSRCDEYDEAVPHSSDGEATCTTSKTCDFCGYVMEASGGHSFTEQIKDEAHLKAAVSCVSGATYWYDCAHCDVISDSLYYTAGKPNEHDFDSNGVCEDCGAHELSYQIVDQGSDDYYVYVQFSAGQKISVFRDGFVIDTVLDDGTVIPGEFVELEWARYYFSGSTDQPMHFYALNKAQFDANEYDYGTNTKQFSVVLHGFKLTAPKGESPIVISPNVKLGLDVQGRDNSIAAVGAYAVNAWADSTEYQLEFYMTTTGSAGGILTVAVESTDNFARPSYHIAPTVSDTTTSSYKDSSFTTYLVTMVYCKSVPRQECSISTATCRTPATCTYCNIVIDPTLDENVHVWSAPCDTTCNEGCGTTRAAGEHTYDDCCDAVCNSEECDFERELTAHVHIGSSVLTNGQYLDEEGNVSATKPTGGYAYLSVDTEGALTLTLHDFTYDGNAYYSNAKDIYAVIYSALDLTVKVEGENLLFVNEFEGESYLNSIVVNGNLTVKGDGKATSSLEIGASAELMYRFDALSAYHDLTIENVSIKAIDTKYGISSVGNILITNSDLYLATMYECIWAAESVTVSGSIVELYSVYEFGIYSENSYSTVSIDGSDVYIHAPNGIGSGSSDVSISCIVTNSNLTIDCYDNAILCSALEATDSSISITGMTCDGENDAMISASIVELEDCTLYIDTNNYLGLEADVASFVSCDIFVYGSYGGLYAGELTLEGCTLVSEGENYGALGAEVLRIVGGTLTSDFVLADVYESFTVEEEAQLNGIVYVYDSDTQTTTVTVYGEACVGKDQWLDLTDDGINWHAIAGLRVDGWLYLPEGVTGQQIAELGLTGDGIIECGYGDQTAYYDTSGNPLYHYEYEGNLDFSNVGDGEGQTPAVGNGYSFNADTLTLTLTNFTIRGDLYLPHGNVTVVLNGDVEVYGSIYLAEGEGNALISLEGDGWLLVDEGVEIMHESVLTSEMELSLEIGENVTLYVDDYVTATSLSVYGRLETQYVYIYALHGGGLRIGDGGVVAATGCLEIVLSIGEEPNAADVDPWDYVVIDGGHLSGGIIPVYGDLDGAYGIFFVPEGLETNYYWYGQRAFIQSLPIESHVYDNDCDTTCDVCGAERTIVHDFTGEWQKDASGHWHVCETEGCTVTDTKAGHTSSGSATEDTPETCTVCGFIITPATGHINHTSSGEYGYDANGHWFKCVGCESEKLSPAGHNFDNACDVDCICGYQRTIEHDYTELKFNDTHHWYECSVCGAEQSGSRVAHNGGDATCVAKAICSCGQSYGGYGSHRFGQWQEELPATCVATGTKAHKTCSTCEKHFAEDGVTEINDLTIAIDANNHDIATEWTGVENGHYHKCKRIGCTYHTALEDHQPDRAEATEDDPVKCSVCEYIITPAIGHTIHTSNGIYGYDANGHWFKCVGCESEKVSPAEHSFDNDCDTDCACGYVRTITHNFTGEWQKDASGHWHVCETEGCTVTDTKVGHTSSGSATEDTPETCTVCGFVITPATGHITHASETEWQKNETHHWHECTGCDGQELEKAAHNDGNNDGSCDACGYAMSVTPPPHTHAHGSAWVTDANEHWNECECGDKANKAAHVDDNGDNKCDTCDYAMPKAPSNNETEKPTDATEGEKDDSIETEAPADKGCGGCGSSAAISAIAIVAVIGTAAVIKKKED